MNARSSLYSFFLVLIIAAASFAEEHIAIAPATGTNISKENSNSITSYFIRKYNKIAEYKVIEWDSYSAQLKKHSFMWNTSFSDLSNALALARILSVNYVILPDFGKTECHITIFDLKQSTTIEKITRPFNGKTRDFLTNITPEIVTIMEPVARAYVESLPKIIPVVKKPEPKAQEQAITYTPEEPAATQEDATQEEATTVKLNDNLDGYSDFNTADTEVSEPEETAPVESAVKEEKPERERKIRKKRVKEPKEKRVRTAKRERKPAKEREEKAARVKEPKDEDENSVPLFVEKIREKRREDSLSQQKEQQFTETGNAPELEVSDETLEEGADEEGSKYLLGRLEERRKQRKAEKAEKKKQKMKEIEKKRLEEEAEMNAKMEKLRQKAKVTTVDLKAEAE